MACAAVALAHPVVPAESLSTVTQRQVVTMLPGVGSGKSRTLESALVAATAGSGLHRCSLARHLLSSMSS